MFKRIKSRIKSVASKVLPEQFRAPAAGCLAASLISMTPAMANESSTSAMTLQEVLTTVTSILTAALGWVSSTITMITANPLLLVFVVIPLIFLGVNMLRRLFNV